MASQLKDCIDALGPALTSVTSLQLTSEVQAPAWSAWRIPLLLINIWVILCWFMCFWLQQRFSLAGTGDFEDFVKPSHSYLRQLLKTSPHVQHLSVDGCLLWSKDGLLKLGAAAPKLTSLQIVEQKVSSAQAMGLASEIKDRGLQQASVIISPSHGCSSVFAALPGCPALWDLVKNTFFCEMTEQGSSRRTHAIMCSSNGLLERLINTGCGVQVSAGVEPVCCVEGWGALPATLQILSFSAPAHMFGASSWAQAQKTPDHSLWMLDVTAASSVKMRVMQFMCMRNIDSSWTCARHPCPHQYVYNILT